MKNFYSNYIGNLELWIELICAWQKIKGRGMSRGGVGKRVKRIGADVIQITIHTGRDRRR